MDEAGCKSNLQQQLGAVVFRKHPSNKGKYCIWGSVSRCGLIHIMVNIYSSRAVFV